MSSGASATSDLGGTRVWTVLFAFAEVKDELEERMAEIKKTAQRVRQKLKGKFAAVHVDDTMAPATSLFKFKSFIPALPVN